MAAGSSKKLLDVDFKISGSVQGVFFRKYTQKEAKKLHLVGWVMNTTQGTVIGQVQGPEEKINDMKKWLRSTGSPKSVITNAEFSQKEIDKLTYDSFIIKK